VTKNAGFFASNGGDTLAEEVSDVVPAPVVRRIATLD
jgi:hypothetical protein